MLTPYAELLRRQDYGGVADIMPVTNAIESLHSQVRKAVRGRGHFPSDEAASKLIWLVL